MEVWSPKKHRLKQIAMLSSTVKSQKLPKCETNISQTAQSIAEGGGGQQFIMMQGGGGVQVCTNISWKSCFWGELRMSIACRWWRVRQHQLKSHCKWWAHLDWYLLCKFHILTFFNHWHSYTNLTTIATGNGIVSCRCASHTGVFQNSKLVFIKTLWCSPSDLSMEPLFNQFSYRYWPLRMLSPPFTTILAFIQKYCTAPPLLLACTSLTIPAKRFRSTFTKLHQIC